MTFGSRNESGKTPNTKVVPRIGISACLLGYSVRYNGGHKKQDWIVERLSRWVTFDSICPEVAMGLSVPRPALRLDVDNLRSSPDQVRMVTSHSKVDYTELAKTTVERILSSDEEGLAEIAGSPPWDGFILKKDSPSCGVERVRVYPPSGIPLRTGVGFFARALQDKYPLLPVIEEGRLSDPVARDHFIERVFGYHRLKRVGHESRDAKLVADLQGFHRKYKLVLMEHSPKHYERLGKMIGTAGKGGISLKFLEEYRSLFMEALKIPVTPHKRVNVLQHAMGYMKSLISSGEKQMLLELFEQHREGILPSVVPIKVLQFLVQKYEIEYLRGQFFFRDCATPAIDF
jgi:uncharacterized protein YbbK (DUF523 family)/uncharacterized protein YbgA (DUF1722 family)